MTDQAPARNVRLTVTVPQAADMLGVSRSHAYALVHSGRLPALQLGRRIVVPLDSLRRLIDGELDG